MKNKPDWTTLTLKELEITCDRVLSLTESLCQECIEHWLTLLQTIPASIPVIVQNVSACIVLRVPYKTWRLKEVQGIAATSQAKKTQRLVSTLETFRGARWVPEVCMTHSGGLDDIPIRLQQRLQTPHHQARKLILCIQDNGANDDINQGLTCLPGIEGFRSNPNAWVKLYQLTPPELQIEVVFITSYDIGIPCTEELAGNRLFRVNLSSMIQAFAYLKLCGLSDIFWWSINDAIEAHEWLGDEPRLDGDMVLALHLTRLFIQSHGGKARKQSTLPIVGSRHQLHDQQLLRSEIDHERMAQDAKYLDEVNEAMSWGVPWGHAAAVVD